MYHWPGMRGDIIPEVCFLCNLCIYTRPGKEIQATSSQHSSPWTISLYRNGLQGDGFEQTGQLYALVFQDYLTKWLEVYAVEDRKATTVADCLADFMVFQLR